MSLLISVIQGSILEVETDVIVNAANSHGIMGGGVAGVIKRVAGQSVEDEARQQAPIMIGEAALTSGGKTKFKSIIHAPTMAEPAMRIPPQNVAMATKAALKLADERAFQSIAMPGMGTGVGGVLHGDAASLMVKEIRRFSSRTLKTVILVDVDPMMVEAWRNQLA
ncbi:MAG: macro domain-containing protein [Nitrospiraceae bacterium]